jgi:hypothetical protein
MDDVFNYDEDDPTRATKKTRALRHCTIEQRSEIQWS